MFHLLIVNAVYVVYESKIVSSSDKFNMAKANMISWVKNGFNGGETFEDVCKICHPAIMSIQDYMNHITKLPLISSLFKVCYQEEEKVFMVSLIMSLECFETYVNSITADDRHIGTPEHEYTMLQNGNDGSLDQAYDDVDNPYENAIHVNNATNTSIVDKELIKNMYRNAFKVAESGNQGKGLPAPISRCVKQKKKKSSYLLCEFQDSEDKTYFMKWLTLDDAIKVILH